MEKDKKIIDYFAVLKKENIIGPAYLFSGSFSPLFFSLFKLINCQKSPLYCDACWSCKQISRSSHPDLFILEPQELSLKIDSVRQAIRFLSLKSYHSRFKILLVKQAQKLTPESANLFLKTLEEPPKNCFIALSVDKVEDVLPTIASRCRKIYLPFSEGKKNKLEPALSFFSGNKPSFFFSPPVFKKRKDFALFLESLIVLLHIRIKSLLKCSPDFDCRVFPNLETSDLIAGLQEVLKIYRAHNSINMNLALNIIKLRLQ